ncbi:MAG: lysylphosphatidylglycerol synthase transmembrane domain-containing protein [bacterium]
MSRRTRFIFLIAGAALLGLLVVRVDLAGVGRSLAAADVRWLGAAVGLLVIDVLVKALRWRLMVHRLTGAHLDVPSAVTAILAGVAAASFSPARSVDLAKPLLLRQRFGVGLATSTGAVLVERYLDGAALVILFGVSIALLPVARGSQFQPALAAAGLLLVAGIVVIASPEMVRALLTRIIRRLPLPHEIREGSSRVGDAFASSLALWRTRRNIWLLLGASVLAALCEATRLMTVFRAMGEPMGFSGAMLAFSTANLVAILALIPGGIGVAELSMAGVAAIVLRTQAMGGAIVAAVVLDRVLSYYLVVGIGALILVGMSRITRRETVAGQSDG